MFAIGGLLYNLEVSDLSLTYKSTGAFCSYALSEQEDDPQEGFNL
jgi:hypothetical protein